MKKIIFILTALICVMPVVSQGAVNIKKAASVSAKKTDAMESATSFVPTVIGLVQGVKSLQQQQQQLTAECAPTADEIRFVNELVQEWAKTSEVSAATAVSGLGDEVCNGNGAYKSYMEYADSQSKCYETFASASDEETIWKGFPKASRADICDAGNKNCKVVSNIYDVFGRIPFTDDDYTQKEARYVSSLKAKAERCSDAKVNAAKRELYGGFVAQTLSGVGQSTGAAGTSSVLEAVSSMGGSGDVKSLLPSLGQMATQVLDK